MPTVIEIVAEYLQQNEFDGLANSSAECGCFINDLAPCGEIGGECMAGRKAVIDDEVVCVEVHDAELPGAAR